MSFKTNFNLRSNPFRMTPGINSNELIWAGFSDLKKKFEYRIKRSMRIPSSSLVLNWGEYGCGKTHAAKFFGESEVINQLATDSGSKPAYHIYVTLPKGKSPVEETFTSIIDKLDIPQLRASFLPHKDKLESFIEEVSDNNHIKSVLTAFFDSSIDANDVKKYLYRNMTNTDITKKFLSVPILRAINIETDYSKFLSGLFSCLTFEKNVYSCVMLWIDEFEDVASMTNVNIDKINSFIRDIIDNTPDNLLIFLNLTQTAFFTSEDLGQYLSEAVKSKIKDRINFDLPKESEFITYLKELFLSYREGVTPSEIYPFNDEKTIEYILKNLGDTSLRRFNDALNVTLELADLDGKYPIDEEYIKQNKNDIIGLKIQKKKSVSEKLFFSN